MPSKPEDPLRDLYKNLSGKGALPRLSKSPVNPS
jgi:hypothetical protein